MAQRLGKYTLRLENRPRVQGFASIVGKKEGDGPLERYFDAVHDDTTLGQDSWEKAESRLQQEAAEEAIKKAGVTEQDIQYILAGDLLNQCISSTFGLQSLNIPFWGQYGACSTMAQTLSLASVLVDAGAAERCLAVTSSHFCSAERQFRFPLEYGGQRTPTAQWTATASGAVVVGQSGDGPWVSAVTAGRIRDLGIKDAANMGAAMAPAAAQTLFDFLTDTQTKPADYDLILTGDLGLIGSSLMEEILRRDGIEIAPVHNDCGLMLYDREKQDVHAGGSGCGCSGAVLCSVVLQRMCRKKLRNVLFIGTGALMSTTSSQQGESIPGIAHLVYLQA
ncbi:MAG TPA: stage V sporulation protein AD [Candidatus Gallacutalibacter pullicola]|uniref:Stage V sporulation protein AD n=1 Tax=Candidatus Gallacutalibacter pullicola TaxID=2840830 RepID=A0A9D1J0C1_9FIRM|nr:stage V sporulation protein AD [Candidatus Gallacutalibacter pullicola]